MDETQNQQSAESLDQISKREHRELKRQEEEKSRSEFLRSVKRVKILKRVGLALLVIVLIAGAFWWAQKTEAEKPGEAVPVQPRDHINPGDPIPGIYHSNPPVSGWHYPDPAEWGIYDEPISDQILIHNLEHGGIWISYFPDAPPEIVESLKKLVSEYKTKVILTPRALNDNLIAVAAWGRLDKFNYFDEERIKKFIKAFMNKGPEFVP